jgi:hypothetical protein
MLYYVVYGCDDRGGKETCERKGQSFIGMTDLGSSLTFCGRSVGDQQTTTFHCGEWMITVDSLCNNCGQQAAVSILGSVAHHL